MPTIPEYEIYAMRGLSSGPYLWLPGHDPAVLQRFPTHSAGIAYLK
jgi:hypothetical protein